MEVEKQRVARGGKNIIFRGWGGIIIVFGPKYRPLHISKKNLLIYLLYFVPLIKTVFGGFRQ
jgi:hypothetical protein